MKNSRFNLFAAATLAAISTTTVFAADRVRNATANALNLDTAWDSVAPTAADRAVWNSISVGSGQTLGGDVAWGGILISALTPSSGPSFTNALNPSAVTITLGASGIDLNNGSSTNRGITFESNTKLALASNQTWKLGLGQSSANMTVSSVVSGSASLTVTRDVAGVNYAQLTGANTFDGGVTIGSNALVRVGASSVTSTTSVISGPLGTGNLTLNDGATLATVSGTGIVVAVPQINLLGNVTVNQVTGGTGRLQIAGTWDLGGGSRSINVQKTSAGIGSGNEGLGFYLPTGFTSPKIQNGSLTLTTTAGTAGAPAQVRFNTTTFDTNTALTVADGVVLTAQNGTFFATGANAPALTLSAPDTRGGAVLQLGDGTTTMRSAEVYSLSGGGTISAANTTTAGNTGTVTINHGNGASFSGAITETGFGKIALTKSGAGSQTIGGTNTYTGITTVSGTGTLQFAKKASLYNNTPASWTDTNIVVNSGSTLALNAGGAGEFDAGSISSLAALGTAAGGFKSGAKIGIDTTNAGGSFNYSSVLANPNTGLNTLALRKLGTGTLVLSQVNTYTGGTFVEGGTLKIVQPGGIHTGSLVLNSGTAFEADFSALVAAGQITNTTTGSGTIIATPPNASQLSFTSGALTGFAGSINVKASPASSGRVDFNGLIGTGSTINIESGATARLANGGTFSGVTVNLVGTGGSGPGALRLEAGTLDSSCAVNLTGNGSIGGFTLTATVDAVIADGVNDYSLTKSGSSILALTALNTYSGGTNVAGGTLRISKPYLADAAPVTIGATGAVLDLNFDESGGAVTDTVATLTIGTTQMAAGVYGATGSGAAIIDDTHFAGAGTLTVTSGPATGNYASWATDNGISGQPPSGDFDKDGLTNLMEYALGKSPTVSSVPGGTLASGIVTFNKGSAAIANGDVSWVIQKSTDLLNWSNEVTQAAGDLSPSISYMLPNGQQRVFARLRAVQP